MITTDISSSGKKPLVLRPETVRTVEMSDQLVQRASDPSPFYQVDRNAHPSGSPERPAFVDVRPFHEVARNAHPSGVPVRNAHPNQPPAR